MCPLALWLVFLDPEPVSGERGAVGTPWVNAQYTISRTVKQISSNLLVGAWLLAEVGTYERTKPSSASVECFKHQNVNRIGGSGKTGYRATSPFKRA